MPVVIILTQLLIRLFLWRTKSEIHQLKGMEEIDHKLDELGKMQSTGEKVSVYVCDYRSRMADRICPWFWDSYYCCDWCGSNVLTVQQCIDMGSGRTASCLVNNLYNLFSINSLGMTIWKTGGADWITSLLSGALNGLSPITVLVLVGLFTVFIHLLVPVNTALVSIIIQL